MFILWPYKCVCRRSVKAAIEDEEDERNTSFTKESKYSKLEIQESDGDNFEFKEGRLRSMTEKSTE